ncbi:hypothetical protein LSAT2_006045, partial [Lamellibrachia satsuma]
MTIRDVQTNTVWHFVCDKWLADSENVRQTLHVSTSIAFSYNFALMFMQKMFDTQMLFSLFSRSINSTFTSVERVSCGVTAITMAVLVNSVVYKQSGNMIAKRSFSTKQSSVMYAIGDAAVGILSAVITIPLCYLLENTFRRARRTFHGRCIGEHFLVLLPTKTTSTKHIKEEEDKSFGDSVIGNIDFLYNVFVVGIIAINVLVIRNIAINVFVIGNIAINVLVNGNITINVLVNRNIAINILVNGNIAINVFFNGNIAINVLANRNIAINVLVNRNIATNVLVNGNI